MLPRIASNITRARATGLAATSLSPSSYLLTQPSSRAFEVSAWPCTTQQTRPLSALHPCNTHLSPPQYRQTWGLNQKRHKSNVSETPREPPQATAKQQTKVTGEDTQSAAPQETSDPVSSDASKIPEETLEEMLEKLRKDHEENPDKAQADEAKAFADLPDMRQGIPSNFSGFNFDKSSATAKAPGEESEGGSSALNITEVLESDESRREGGGPKEEYVSSIDRRRQAVSRTLYSIAGFVGIGAFVWFGRDWEDEVEAKAHPDAPSGLSPMAWYARFRERLGSQFSHYTEPAFPTLLPDPPTDPTMRMPYTLVLSLEDLLITSTWTRQDGYKIAKRPGVDYFLRYLCQYYELVIFTTVQTANGDLVMRQLDPFQLAMPIYRDGTRYLNGELVKDLTYLNRDLSKTIIIDTVAEHVRLQPENAIILPKWTGKKEDQHTRDLVALIPFLEYIAGMELSDVRKVLASYKGKDIPQEFHRRELKTREEFNKRHNEGKKKTSRGGAGGLGGLSGALGFKPVPAMVIPGEQTPMEAFAEGKMLSDQIRERGQKGYLALEKQIKENGEMWLKMRADEEKKANEESLKFMQSSAWGFFGGAPKGEEPKKG